MVSQLDILETMTPTEFLSLREFLASSSGFQSAQFWELEFVLGHKRPQVLSRFLRIPPNINGYRPGSPIPDFGTLS